MPTCLFTGDPLGPDTTIEHTIPRSLGGRFRSTIVSSNRFNNASSPFDDLLWQPYGALFNYLAPLLSREHAQRAIELEIGRERQPLHPGGELGLRGMRVDQRDAQGRPEVVVHEDPQVVNRFAANAGWGRFIETHEIANVQAEGTRRVPVLAPDMEVAALKCALLTLDHVLAGDANRFTRAGWLSSSRDSIRDIVLNDANRVEFIDRVSWGIQYEELAPLGLMRHHIPDPVIPFEHLVVASGDPGTGAIDVAWLLAGIDPWAFRLTCLWDGPPFTVITGCGILRDTPEWRAPVVLPNVAWQLGARSERRSCHPANVARATLERMTADISNARRDGYRRAVDLVERRCDDVVRGGILNLARFDDAEPRLAPGDTSIRTGLERRLRRLFWLRIVTADGLAALRNAVDAAVDALPDAVRRQRVERADARGDAVDWNAWLRCHRSILDALAGSLGLPGDLRTIASGFDPIEA